MGCKYSAKGKGGKRDKTKLAIGTVFPGLLLTNLSGTEQPLESVNSEYTALFFMTQAVAIAGKQRLN